MRFSNLICFLNQIPSWIPMYLHLGIFWAWPAFLLLSHLFNAEIMSELNVYTTYTLQCKIYGTLFKLYLSFSAQSWHSLSEALTLTIEFKDTIIAKMKLVIYHGADGGLSAGLSKILAVEKYPIFCDRGKNFNILTLKNFCGMEFFCSLQDIQKNGEFYKHKMT